MITTKEKKKPFRGNRIPQHRLLTRAEWNYLLHDGRISKFTYWTTYGPYHRFDTQTINYPHAESITIYAKDYINEPRPNPPILRGKLRSRAQ